MELEVKTAGVAHRSSLLILPPSAGLSRHTVHALGEELRRQEGSYSWDRRAWRKEVQVELEVGINTGRVWRRFGEKNRF